MNDARPLVSVVTATWNRADLLAQTIESVVSQTYSPLEYIVVDDGSTDGTADLLQRYGAQIRAVRIDHGADYGASALRRGLEEARGDLVCFLDHDDLFLPHKIAAQVDALRHAPDAVAAHCGYHYADSEGNWIEHTLDLPDMTYVEMLCANVVWSGGPLIRREHLLKAGGYDPAWCGDWRTWLHLLRGGGRMVCVQEPLGVYRITPGSMMSRLEMLEQSSIETLDIEFARGDLPPEVCARREEAYGNMRLFLACRWFAAGAGIEGARNLQAALGHRPALQRDPARLAALLIADATSPRTADADLFLNTLLEHLPVRAERLSTCVAEMRGAICAVAAFRCAARSDRAGARQALVSMTEINPGWISRRDTWSAMLVDWALRTSSCDAHDFIDVVFDAMPVQMGNREDGWENGWEAGREDGWKKDRGNEREKSRDMFRRHVHADTQVLLILMMPWLQRADVLRKTCDALTARPHWLSNRGVLSAAMRLVLS